MKDFKLIENQKDIQITNHDFIFTEGLSVYVAQKLRITLSIFKGEWYLDINLGLPYFETILTKNPNLGLIEDLYKTRILAIEGVAEITAFDMTVEKEIRNLIVDFTVVLTTGEELTLQV